MNEICQNLRKFLFVQIFSSDYQNYILKSYFLEKPRGGLAKPFPIHPGRGEGELRIIHKRKIAVIYTDPKPQTLARNRLDLYSCPPNYQNFKFLIEIEVKIFINRSNFPLFFVFLQKIFSFNVNVVFYKLVFRYFINIVQQSKKH